MQRMQSALLGQRFPCTWSRGAVPAHVVSMQTLIDSAIAARLRAYAPYSNFQVGAALLANDGRVFTGCNVENLSYGLTICAERNAIFAAVAAGVKEFAAIAIVADTREPISPCGACRQVMAEFGDFQVLSTTLAGKTFESTVAALLPRAKTGILDKE
jgi:cytidine deaminase